MLIKRSKSVLCPSIIVTFCLLKTTQVICDTAIEDALSIGDLAEGDAIVRSRARSVATREGDEIWKLPSDCGRIPIQGRFGLRNSLEEFAEDAKSTSASGIPAGRDVKIGEFPPFVHIRTRNEKMEKDCGGAILNKDYVITTASCLLEDVEFAVIYPTIYRPAAIPSATAEDGKQVKPKWYTSDTFCRSDKYDEITYENGLTKFAYDFAIIKLNQSIEFNDYVQPVCLAQRALEKFRVAYSVYLGLMGADVVQPMILQALPVKKLDCPDDHKQFSHICLRSADSDKYSGSSCHGKFVYLTEKPTNELGNPSNIHDLSHLKQQQIREVLPCLILMDDYICTV